MLSFVLSFYLYSFFPSKCFRVTVSNMTIVFCSCNLQDGLHLLTVKLAGSGYFIFMSQM